MRYSEQFMEYIEYAFHAFCKVVLRHEANVALKQLRKEWERLEYEEQKANNF